MKFILTEYRQEWIRAKAIADARRMFPNDDHSTTALTAAPVPLSSIYQVEQYQPIFGNPLPYPYIEDGGYVKRESWENSDAITTLNGTRKLPSNSDMHASSAHSRPSSTNSLVNVRASLLDSANMPRSSSTYAKRRSPPPPSIDARPPPTPPVSVPDFSRPLKLHCTQSPQVKGPGLAEEIICTPTRGEAVLVSLGPTYNPDESCTEDILRDEEQNCGQISDRRLRRSGFYGAPPGSPKKWTPTGSEWSVGVGEEVADAD